MSEIACLLLSKVALWNNVFCKTSLRDYFNAISTKSFLYHLEAGLKKRRLWKIILLVTLTYPFTGLNLTFVSHMTAETLLFMLSLSYHGSIPIFQERLCPSVAWLLINWFKQTHSPSFFPSLIIHRLCHVKIPATM